MSLVEYAQARMQARFGERPDAARWRELDGAHDLGACLDALRGTALRRWVAGLDARADLHQVDRGLREAFRAHVGEVARWMPEAWRPCVLWLRELVEPRAEVPAAGAGRRAGPHAAWLAEWRRRWPADAAATRGLQRIAAAVLSHRARFARAGVRGAWAARGALERELRVLFRRSALAPEAAFAYLGLIALDLERLRAALVRRILQRPRAAA